ncbi:MAG: hypothetical protein HRU19_01110 [Pseudobacteriovorax sp.]|nr:hypothetical protein [Pseudobacteriovorax sp.]
MIQSLIRAESLPIYSCGYPLINKDLRWSKGLYVTGALAEIQIGPLARNIAGARKAAECITRAELAR